MRWLQGSLSQQSHNDRLGGLSFLLCFSPSYINAQWERRHGLLPISLQKQGNLPIVPGKCSLSHSPVPHWPDLSPLSSPLTQPFARKMDQTLLAQANQAYSSAANGILSPKTGNLNKSTDVTTRRKREVLPSVVGLLPEMKGQRGSVLCRSHHQQSCSEHPCSSLGPGPS